MTPAETKERNSQRWQDMETEVMDVADMARATALVVVRYMEVKKAAANSGFFTGAQLVDQIDEWSQAVDFMVHRLRNMANAMQRYYE